MSWCARRCALALLAAIVSTGACGGPSSQNVGFDLAAPPLDEPIVTLTSAGNRWQVALWTSPNPPRKGTVEVLYRIVDAVGAPVQGLVVSVMPWMPAHGHGGAAVGADAVWGGSGWYLVKPLALFMPGRWELRTSIEGYVDDGVMPIVELP